MYTTEDGGDGFTQKGVRINSESVTGVIRGIIASMSVEELEDTFAEARKRLGDNSAAKAVLEAYASLADGEEEEQQ
jgi:hypothetical protein